MVCFVSAEEMTTENTTEITTENTESGIYAILNSDINKQAIIKAYDLALSNNIDEAKNFVQSDISADKASKDELIKALKKIASGEGSYDNNCRLVSAYYQKYKSDYYESLVPVFSALVLVIILIIELVILLLIISTKSFIKNKLKNQFRSMLDDIKENIIEVQKIVSTETSVSDCENNNDELIEEIKILKQNIEKYEITQNKLCDQINNLKSYFDEVEVKESSNDSEKTYMEYAEDNIIQENNIEPVGRLVGLNISGGKIVLDENGNNIRAVEGEDNKVKLYATECFTQRAFRDSFRKYFDINVSGKSDVITEKPAVIQKEAYGGYVFIEKGKVIIK